MRAWCTSGHPYRSVEASTPTNDPIVSAAAAGSGALRVVGGYPTVAAALAEKLPPGALMLGYTASALLTLGSKLFCWPERFNSG